METKDNLEVLSNAGLDLSDEVKKVKLNKLYFSLMKKAEVLRDEYHDLLLAFETFEDAGCFKDDVFMRDVIEHPKDIYVLGKDNPWFMYASFKTEIREVLNFFLDNFRSYYSFNSFYFEERDIFDRNFVRPLKFLLEDRDVLRRSFDIDRRKDPFYSPNFGSLYGLLHFLSKKSFVLSKKSTRKFLLSLRSVSLAEDFSEEEIAVNKNKLFKEFLALQELKLKVFLFTKSLAQFQSDLGFLKQAYEAFYSEENFELVWRKQILYFVDLRIKEVA